MAEKEFRYEAYRLEDAEYCIVAFGIAARVAKNAVDAAREQGIRVGLIRPVTLWPFPSAAISETASRVKAYLSVELSMGQMIDDVRMAVSCARPVSLCNRCGGMIPSPVEVLRSIQNMTGGDAV